MPRFRKKPVVVEAITFDELVAHGRTQTLDTDGMPWSFDYAGHPITHEDDDCYLIPTLEGTMKFGRTDMLITGVQGEIYPCKGDIFEVTYETANASAIYSDDEPVNPAPWPDPTPEMLETSEFNAAWNVIMSWDINVPSVYAGYCGATGNHVRAILDALRPLTDTLQLAKSLIDIQAEDEGLWFEAEHITEAALQSALRKLHEVIEGKTQAENVIELLHGKQARESLLETLRLARSIVDVQTQDEKLWEVGDARTGPWVKYVQQALLHLHAAIEGKTQEITHPDYDNPRFLSASEAIFGFTAWLTGRKERVKFSSTDNAAVAADLVGLFCESQGLAEPRDDFGERLKPYPES